MSGHEVGENNMKFEVDKELFPFESHFLRDQQWLRSSLCR